MTRLKRALPHQCVPSRSGVVVGARSLVGGIYPGKGETLLEPGKVYQGPLVISEDGTAVRCPGGGRALVLGGVHAHGVSDLTLEGLDLRPAPAQENMAWQTGLLLSNSGDGSYLENVTVRNCTASGWSGYGMQVWAEKVGFRGLAVERCRFHNNKAGGLFISGAEASLSHSFLNVTDVTADLNPGLPDVHSTGSGILLHSVLGGTVRNSETSRNGETGLGCFGTWAFHCVNLQIWDCNSWGNSVVDLVDGGGFDLDGDVWDSLLVNCRSWHNKGAGFLLCTFDGSGRTRGNRLQGCSSVGDARGITSGALCLYGDVFDTSLVGCTLDVSDSPGGAAVLLESWGNDATLHLRDCRLVVSAGRLWLSDDRADPGRGVFTPGTTIQAMTH